MVTTMVIHVDDIHVAASQDAANIVIGAHNDSFPTKNLGELSWHMGSKYKRVREHCILEYCFNVTKTAITLIGP